MIVEMANFRVLSFMFQLLRVSAKGAQDQGEIVSEQERNERQAVCGRFAGFGFSAISASRPHVSEHGVSTK